MGAWHSKKPNVVQRPTEATSYKSFVGDYGIVKTLGSGASCKVKLAFPKEGDKPVALKIMKEDSANIMELMKQELEIMAKLQHKNVVR